MLAGADVPHAEGGQATLRRFLGHCVAACLCLQAATLAALVPRDCCRAPVHEAEASSPGCHQTARAAQCPMRAPDGTPCPMHAEPAATADAGAGRGGPGSPDQCALRGTCNGPMTAMVAHLSQVGILPPAGDLPADDTPASPVAALAEGPDGRRVPPDSPPPRD